MNSPTIHVEATRKVNIELRTPDGPRTLKFMPDAVTEVPRDLWDLSGKRRHPDHPTGRELLEQAMVLQPLTEEQVAKRVRALEMAPERPFSPAPTGRPPAPILDVPIPPKAMRGRAAFEGIKQDR